MCTISISSLTWPRFAGQELCLGLYVISVVVPGARRDVFLSLPRAREQAYAETDPWPTAYPGTRTHELPVQEPFRSTTALRESENFTVS